MSNDVCPMGGKHVYGGIVAGHVKCVNCFHEVTWASAEDNRNWVPLISKEWD